VLVVLRAVALVLVTLLIVVVVKLVVVELEVLDGDVAVVCRRGRSGRRRGGSGCRSCLARPGVTWSCGLARALSACKVSGVDPSFVAVPDSTPVVGSKLKPSGVEGSTLTSGAGMPAIVNVKE
jgi:hypothetical protein